MYELRHVQLKLLGQNQKGIIMKWTTLSFKQLAQQKTLRMDAKYWIKKKAQASSNKRQATGSKQGGPAHKSTRVQG
jgi:hypothetical protein